MAIKFTVTYNTDTPTAVNFYGLDDYETQSRGYVDAVIGGPNFQHQRYNIPGVEGNFTTYMGFRGRTVELRAMYIGALATIITQWRGDQENFGRYTCSLSDGTETFSRAHLRPGSGARIGDEIAWGSPTKQAFEVRYLFDCEQVD